MFQRPYSISSSRRLYENEVHATVALVEYSVKSKSNKKVISA